MMHGEWSPRIVGQVTLHRPVTRKRSRAKLRWLVKSLGLLSASRVLDVTRSRVRRWLDGEEAIAYDFEKRISDLEYVLSRALLVMHDDEVGPWLTSPEPLLGDAPPAIVLAIQGVGPVIAALDGIYAGVLS